MPASPLPCCISAILSGPGAPSANGAPPGSSREGVAALATFPPALAFAALWWALGPDAMATRVLGAVAAVLGLVTVGCTAMIYASLKPIRQWHNPHTAADYMIYAIFSGAVLLACLWSLWFGAARGLAVAALLAAITAGAAKFAYWRFIDKQKPLVTLASATGLTAFGTVRPLDRPHFTENYILKEMGYQIARKHAVKLRRIAVAFAFGLPALLALLAALRDRACDHRDRRRNVRHGWPVRRTLAVLRRGDACRNHLLRPLSIWQPHWMLPPRLKDA